jgi:hypothetical protein
MTFNGLGYHEHSERWFTDEWFWYQSTIFPHLLEQRITKEKAEKLLQQRLETIKPYIKMDTPSKQEKSFEFLVDLTDDDGALVGLGSEDL